MKKFIFSIFLITCLFFSFLFSQDYKGKGRIFGYVYDEEGNPLEEVKITLYFQKAQDGFQLMTDAKGKWVASWIRGGLWNLDFEKVGYMPEKITLRVKELGENPEIKVEMKKIEGLAVTNEIKADLIKGNKLFDEKNYEEGIKVYENILETFPDAYIINKNIGNCYFQLEKFDKAEEHYKKVLQENPSDIEVTLAVGNCYSNRGENEKALEWYRKIEIEKIEDSNILYNVGTTFYNNSQFEEALRYYKKAVEIQSDFIDANYQLGLTYLTLGLHQDAIDIFNEYLKLDPNSERASQVNGFIEFLKKK